MRDMYMQYPIAKSIWCHLTNTTRYRIMEFFLVIFYHAIPGLLYDSVLKFTDNPRRLMPLYRKTHLFMVKLRYFMNQEWRFCNRNMFDVYDRYVWIGAVYLQSINQPLFFFFVSE